MYTLTYEGFTIYDPRLTDRDIYNVSTHLAVDEAGSMSFDMPPTHPHLSELAKLKGRLELCSDSSVLWRGRITEDSVDFDGVITIEAEGQLACLNDSIVEPYNFPEDYEDTEEYKSATNVVEFWLKKLLENHNSQVSDEQQIKLGTVTVTDPNNYFSRSCEDYSTTWDVVCDKLRDSSLGGHFLVRYESDGTYLDYVEDYPLTNTQSVEFAQNLLDLTDELDATEVYTAILPVGKDGLTIASLPDGEVTTGLIKEGKVIYSTKGVENYGRITSVQTWDDVSEASNLRTKAATLLGSTGVMLSRSISVTAVDLHCTDETIASLRVGRYTPIVSEPHGLDVRYVLSELDLDIQDPGSTRLTFGATSKSMSDRANNLRANMRNVSDTANAATSTATAAQSALAALQNSTGNLLIQSGMRIKDVEDPPDGANWSFVTFDSYTTLEGTGSSIHFMTGSDGYAYSNGIGVKLERETSGLTAGTTITFSCYVKGTIGEGNTASVIYYTAMPIASKVTGGNFYEQIHGDTLELSATEWKQFKVTLTMPEVYANATADYFGIVVGLNSEVWLKDLKLELGDTSSVYIPAVEDVTDSVEALKTTTKEWYTELTDKDGELASRVGSLETTVGDSETGITALWTEVNQTDTKISASVGSMETTVKEYADGKVEAFQTKVEKNITFDDNFLTLSASNSTSQVNITNDRMNFTVDGVTTAYISNQTMMITSANITHDMTLGNFAFVPRESGNLSLIRREST
jgi:hypothetical protein